MLSERIDLAVPIRLPHGELRTVTAFPLTSEDFALCYHSDDGPLIALANCLRLHPEVAGEIDGADRERVVSAIASLNRRASEMEIAKRPRLTLIAGGKL